MPPGIMIPENGNHVFGDTTIAAGAEINLALILQKTDLNITHFYIDVYADGTAQRYFDTATNLSASLEWHGKFVKSLEPMEEWVFTVRDNEGNASDISLMIGLDTSSGYQTLITHENVMFGAQENDVTGSCYFLADNQIHFNAVVDADTNLQRGIDMLCFYDDEDKNTIASPGANVPDGIFTVNPADWTIVNTSRYFETSLTADDFLNATNDSIVIANYDEAEAKRKAKKLNAGDIYTFRTQGGKLGIFMVSEIVGTTDGSIEINLKVQP
jgi:hypothetical protein